METYYRKRTRIGNQIPPKMDYLGSIAVPLATVMPRHSPMATTPSERTIQCTEQENLAPDFNIEVGSIYEVDHVYLPPRTPGQLKCMRVVMVSEKTSLNVAVRFPSLLSLQKYFCNSMREMYPALDEKFVMGTALANKVLLRQVPSQEFAEKKHVESFWLVSSALMDNLPQDSTPSSGMCLSELKVNGMVRWGVRRQVRFLRRHEDNSNTKSSSSIIKGEDDEEMAPLTDAEKDEEDEEEEEEEEEEQNDDDEEQEEDIKEEVPEDNKNLQRKRYCLRHTAVRKAKKAKCEKQKLKQKVKNNMKRNKCRMIVQYKNPKDRWSEERYKLAEKNLLEVMRTKGATVNNPILRPELRIEARKRIGDTGLLDHLLKHMAGKVAPGGTERFRRRHNAEGAMEYWLESADLINIRKEAGVNDPYWIPPPGWKPGDCLTPNPITAQEFNSLKQEVGMLKRNCEEMVLFKNQMDKEVGRLKREILELQKKKQEEASVTVISNDSDSEISLKAKEQLLMITSAFMAKMEEKFEHFVSKLDEKERAFFTVAEATAAYAEKEKKQAEVEQKSNNPGKEIVLIEGNKQKAPSKLSAAEEKAAKIERLKSGFRICKPQGTFLWPNMVLNPSQTNSSNMSSSKVVVQIEDLFVPTPTSVSSSTASAPPQLQICPVSPVKPVPERRGVKVTVSSTPATTTSNLINLNDDFFNRRPTQTISPTAMIPSPVKLFPSTKDIVGSTEKPESCSAKEGTWLALATPNTTTSDESCQG